MRTDDRDSATTKQTTWRSLHVHVEPELDLTRIIFYNGSAKEWTLGIELGRDQDYERLNVKDLFYSGKYWIFLCTYYFLIK